MSGIMAEKILAKQLQKQRARFKGSTLMQDKIVAKKLQREDERIKRMLAGLDAEDIPPPPIAGVPAGGLLEKKLKQKASAREGLAYATGRIRQQRAVERQPKVEAKIKQPKKPSRRKQSAPKKNARTIPIQMAREDLKRGGPLSGPKPKAGKVYLKRNVRAGAKGDVRVKAPAPEPAPAPAKKAKKAPAKGATQCRTRPRKDGSKYVKCYGGEEQAKTGGIEVAKGVAKKAWEMASREMEGDAVEKAYGFALNRMSVLGKKNDYTFKKDDPRVMVKVKEDVKAPRSRRGFKAGGTFRFVATGKRGGNQYLTFRPTGSGMTIGPIAKSNKNDEVIMTLANYQNLKDKFTIL